MSNKIAPSILSADFLNLQRDIEMINESEADWIHLDIMDGVFVPNLTFGIPIISAVNKFSKKPLDVHMMVVDPDRYFKYFRDAGASLISFHYESSRHIHRSVHAIKSLGVKAGVAINPHSNVDLLEDIISDLDFVCLMAVNPGFGGQRFIERTYTKIDKLKDLIKKNNSSALIEVDGGVDQKNAPELFRTGADILVTGNTVFSSKNPKNTIALMKNSNI